MDNFRVVVDELRRLSANAQSRHRSYYLIAFLRADGNNNFCDSGSPRRDPMVRGLIRWLSSSSRP